MLHHLQPLALHHLKRYLQYILQMLIYYFVVIAQKLDKIEGDEVIKKTSCGILRKLTFGSLVVLFFSFLCAILALLCCKLYFHPCGTIIIIISMQCCGVLQSL